MKNILDKLKEKYEQTGRFDFNFDENIPVEEELQYHILKKRYENLKIFLKNQKNKFVIDDELINLLFFYNDLKEITFIGTDLYANVLFLKEKAPYIYRSVGRDSVDGKASLGKAKKSEIRQNSAEHNKHINCIFEECIRQIKTGGKGELFSYSKCFGKVLYKYTNFRGKDSIHKIEIRINPIINTIIDNEEEISFHRYERKYISDKKETEIPFFSIDISNVRPEVASTKNPKDNLKAWTMEYLPNENFHYGSDIVDPVGDAEVVCNFTGEDNIMCEEARRIELSYNDTCCLLYRYFKQLAKKNGKIDSFDNFLEISIKNYGDLSGELFDIMELSQNHSNENIDFLLNNIDWDVEKKYMKKESAVYKAENTERLYEAWREILFIVSTGLIAKP